MSSDIPSSSSGSCKNTVGLTCVTASTQASLNNSYQPECRAGKGAAPFISKFLRLNSSSFLGGRIPPFLNVE
eukprot:scaffold136281_cov18-Tisochrysis_lutea.AAC.3